MPLSFEVLATDGAARRGRLHTPHGVIDTPTFMPVGTLGAVKGIEPGQLENAGASVMLANLYHLALRPGIDSIETLGGLHGFSGWSKPILTDSGGYQVFSLADRRTIDDDGVSFRSHVDGSPVRFTPQNVVSMQRRLGVDMAMMLDECPPWPASVEQVKDAWDRTLGWARSAREEWDRAPGAGGLFGIVQGGVHLHLREQASADLAALDFDGYAIGGVSVGEPDADRQSVVAHGAPLLPEQKPRYLMGVGYLDDILHAVRCGIDLFDCVLPARNARHGYLFTRRGVVKIKNRRYALDPRPVDPSCRCPACRRLSRAFLHHLFRCREITGPVLATLHNLWCYLDFLRDLRQAIESGALSEIALHNPRQSLAADQPVGTP
ncbi:MAG: tRNA guanosine(34) transglycosylase Tgt [Acidobacteriota bacterium]